MRLLWRCWAATLLSALMVGAQSYSVFAFRSPVNGANPVAVHGGVIYGGTAYGGSSNFDGVVYQLTPPRAQPWTETVIENLNYSLGVGAAGVTVANNGVIYALGAAAGSGACLR